MASQRSIVPMGAISTNPQVKATELKRVRTMLQKANRNSKAGVKTKDCPAAG